MADPNGYDAIIIGSGMGGLTAASALARLKNYRVLVLESHFKLGGFTHTFERPGGYRWDVGLHYVGEMNPGSPLRSAMDFITGNQVKWAKMRDPFEAVLFPDMRVDIPSGAQNFLQKLKGLFPPESENLELYFRDMVFTAENLIGRYIPSSKMLGTNFSYQKCRELASQTFGDYLNAHFQDEKLKGLLAFQWGDYGLPPKLASFGVHSANAKHYLEGGYYPVGSSRVIAQAVAGLVREKGGELKVRNRVSRVLVEGGRATGVQVENRKGVEIIRAPEIYSNIGAGATYRDLLPEGTLAPEELREITLASPFSVVILYLGLKSDCAHLGVHGQNFWIYDGIDQDSIWDRRNELAEGKPSFCYLSFPGLKDPTAPKPTAEIITAMDYEVFEEWKKGRWMNRGPGYDALKKTIAESLLDFVEKRIPGFRSEVKYAELSTPLSIEHFTGHRKGGIYGFPAVPRRYALKSLGPRTPVKGLALVGTDVYNHGITGALVGGILGVAVHHGLGIFPKVFTEMDENQNG